MAMQGEEEHNSLLDQKDQVGHQTFILSLAFMICGCFFVLGLL